MSYKNYKNSHVVICEHLVMIKSENFFVPLIEVKIYRVNPFLFWQISLTFTSFLVYTIFDFLKLFCLRFLSFLKYIFSLKNQHFSQNCHIFKKIQQFIINGPVILNPLIFKNLGQ